MDNKIVRQKLHQFIDSIENNKAEAIYTLFEAEINPDLQRKKLVQSERESYLDNEGKSYSWEEVKQMALNKEQRYAV